jgi:uncharacterized lipoprotein YddW (UPF0748 family)
MISRLIWRRLLAIMSCAIVLLVQSPLLSSVAQSPPTTAPVVVTAKTTAKATPKATAKTAKKAVSRRPKLFPKAKLPTAPPRTALAPPSNRSGTVVPQPELVAPDPNTVLPTDRVDPNAIELPPIPFNPYPTLPKQEIRGVWLTNNDMNILKDRRKLNEAIGQLGQLNFNTVYPVVWNSGYATYHSEVTQQAGIQSFFYQGTEGQDLLAEVTAQAHRQGLTVVPWFEFGFMAPATSELATIHPEWLTQTRTGDISSVSEAGEVAWLNPFHPEVQKFITDLVFEITTKYDVDGIQFDDHMSLPNQFGYDAYTRSLYTQETRKTVPNNPEDAEWTRWRANKITEFMTQLRLAVKARKPQAIISVSPNYADYAYKFHLQDWRTWVDRGLVDELIVQVYSADLNRFVSQLNRSEMVEANQKISTSVGILTGQRRKPVSMGQIQSQVQAAHDRGLGVVFFYYESLWNDAPEPVRDRQMGFQYLFRNPAPRTRGMG